MSRVTEWLNQEFPHQPALSTIKRDGHGIHHPITGMLLCPIRYNWDDEAYGFLMSWNGSAHVHELIGYVLSFARRTPSMIILFIFAFAASIMALMDLATTRKKDSVRGLRVRSGSRYA